MTLFYGNVSCEYSYVILLLYRAKLCCAKSKIVLLSNLNLTSEIQRRNEERHGTVMGRPFYKRNGSNGV